MLMISVDEVMNILEEYAVCTPDEEKSLIQRINQASMFIDNIGTISKWISVKDRLPKKRGNYIVCGKWESGKRSVGEVEFCKDKGEEEGYFRTVWNFDTTHWMPFPKPPKE